MPTSSPETAQGASGSHGSAVRLGAADIVHLTVLSLPQKSSAEMKKKGLPEIGKTSIATLRLPRMKSRSTRRHQSIDAGPRGREIGAWLRRPAVKLPVPP